MIAWKIVKEPTYSFLKFPMKKNVHSSRLKLRYISNTNSKLKCFDYPYWNCLSFTFKCRNKIINTKRYILVKLPYFKDTHELYRMAVNLIGKKYPIKKEGICFLLFLWLYNLSFAFLDFQFFEVYLKKKKKNFIKNNLC